MIAFHESERAALEADGTVRVRESIENLEVPLIGGSGWLRVTAGIRAAASSEGSKSELTSAADSAPHVTKREAKNTTVKAKPETANVFRGE